MFTRRSFLSLTLAAPALALLTRPAAAMSPEVFSDAGLAIRGTDPVAYFKSGAPTKGQEAYGLMWRGAEWRFASAENMESFEMHPEAFAPAYGGYCAYAMSLGHLAPTDPQAWTIHDGRLFLNYSTEVRAIWQADIPGNIAKADKFWPEVLNG